MGKIFQGIDGAVSGKVGSHVGRTWKGRPVLAIYQKNVANPNTPDQQIVRARFGRLNELASAFIEALNLGMPYVANQLRITNPNVFVQKNYGEVTAASPDDVTVNYSGIKVSQGNLPEASFGQVDFGSGQHLQVSCTITGNVDMPGAAENDNIYLVAYCPERNQAVVGSPARRSAANVSVNCPAAWDGMDIHVYGFAISGNKLRRRASVTTYCGTGELA